ncbi:MAG: hypothetical protein WBA12_15810, partial [Catalinimonas sp.]
MRRQLAAGWLWCALLVACGPVASVIDDGPTVQGRLDSLRAVWAPDARTALFRVEADETGEQLRLAGETDHPDALATLRATFPAVDLRVRVLPD